MRCPSSVQLRSCQNTEAALEYKPCVIQRQDEQQFNEGDSVTRDTRGFGMNAERQSDTGDQRQHGKRLKTGAEGGVAANKTRSRICLSGKTTSGTSESDTEDR